MKSPYLFIAKPVNGTRYNNTKKIGGIDFIVNTSEENHKTSNRLDRKNVVSGQSREQS